MRKRRIEILKKYKNILLEYKREQLSKRLSMEVENKLPEHDKSNQKVLTLYKRYK